MQSSPAPLRLDGSRGEGGGQVFRTAISLSGWTGRAVEISRIRAGRSRPGLLRQHLTALRAAAAVCGAVVEGDRLGSTTVRFTPGPRRAGKYRFSVGTAGSVSLVLQTVLPLLVTADGESRIELEGGTHNPSAPPFEFLQRTFIPLLNRMGPAVEARLARHGFFPAGGGRVEVLVRPTSRLRPLEIMQRGRLRRRWATAAVSRLPLAIANRELKVVRERLGFETGELEAQTVTDSAGPGNVLTIGFEFEGLVEVFTGFGKRGVPAERVASETIKEAETYLRSEAPVGPHLADQLLLPLAMAGAGRFRCSPPTRHALTNIEVIGEFLDVAVDAREIAADLAEVTVGGMPHRLDGGPGVG